MATHGSKGDLVATGLVADALEVVQALQQNLQHSDARLQQVEEALKLFDHAQKKINKKVDGIYRLLQ
jgi:predicted DNA-binding protein YlxM (UPF0122 family)